MMRIGTYPTLLLALMGSLDCITTVVGILYFGAVELNPFIAGVVSTNLPGFVVLKALTTVLICIIFVQAERILMRVQKKDSRAFLWTQRLLYAACAGIISFLVVVVTNNVLVLANSL